MHETLDMYMRVSDSHTQKLTRCNELCSQTTVYHEIKRSLPLNVKLNYDVFTIIFGFGV